MRQEKWDKLNKELDDALEEEFGTLKSVFENAKLALREHLLANKEQVSKDLQEMREKSSSDRDLKLEEAAANLADPNICKTDNWIEGAKWQAERMYSEEEVEKIVRDAYTFGEKEFKHFGAFKEWFKQFKKNG